MTDPHLATPAGRPRARALGIPFDGKPGRFNAVTDVAGVSVGTVTLVSGEGPLVIGAGPVRTGVTAILPRPPAEAAVPVMAAVGVLNGTGELTGAWQIEETGLADWPITLTNTASCGTTRDGTLHWMRKHCPDVIDAAWKLPVAAETYDGHLNDINGFHVTVAHTVEAIEKAAGGPVEEGSLGGGTGMLCYQFKGGNGTASRLVEDPAGSFAVGVFVQANFGAREELMVRGVPVGKHLPLAEPTSPPAHKRDGSIIVAIATDAPLLPHQLKRVARRATLGIARTGTAGRQSSGDIFLAFSTANSEAISASDGLARADYLPDARLNPLFTATVEATEEAILNALVANETMTGRDGHVAEALPHDELRALLKRYGRL
ncbi:MAG: P1 family peptidase [Kiloniellales bacterium]